jgi:hypothetical protein
VLIFEEGVIKVIPVDGALASSEAEDRWILVWNRTRRDLSEKNNPVIKREEILPR